jgi:hypothetical protein
MLGEVMMDRHLKGFMDECPEEETVFSSIRGWIVDETGQQQWGRAILTDKAFWFYQRRFGNGLARAVPLEDINVLRTEHRGERGTISIRADHENLLLHVEEDENIADRFSDRLIELLDERD